MRNSPVRNIVKAHRAERAVAGILPLSHATHVALCGSLPTLIVRISGTLGRSEIAGAVECIARARSSFQSNIGPDRIPALAEAATPVRNRAWRMCRRDGPAHSLVRVGTNARNRSREVHRRGSEVAAKDRC